MSLKLMMILLVCLLQTMTKISAQVCSYTCPFLCFWSYITAHKIFRMQSTFRRFTHNDPHQFTTMLSDVQLSKTLNAPGCHLMVITMWTVKLQCGVLERGRHIHYLACVSDSLCVLIAINRLHSNCNCQLHLYLCIYRPSN